METASATVRQLNVSPLKLVSLEGVARHLLRQESLASSRIEGLALGHRRIALADYDLEHSDDQRAADIVRNIRAMAQAVELGAGAKKVTADDVLAVHRTLLHFGEDEAIAGRWRDRPGWVGGQTPTHAVYVPPPHGELPGLHRLDISERAAGGALNELERLGVLKQVKKRIRGRVWECPDLFEAIRPFESTLRTA